MTVAEITKTILPDDIAENLIAFCENRKAVYTFLARCYEKEIDKEFGTIVAHTFTFDSDNAALMSEIDSLKTSLTELDEAKLENLAIVFNRVFFGMGPRTAQKAFPYESVYTSGKGLMMQASYAEVKALYEKKGFIKNPAFTEPEDHIAIELSFMANLCECAEASLQRRDEEEATALLTSQREFLSQHLLNWTASFLADMKGSAEEGFYWHLASLTELFLQEDLTALSEVLD